VSEADESYDGAMARARMVESEMERARVAFRFIKEHTTNEEVIDLCDDFLKGDTR
jgi:hypothetical protein